MGSPAFMPTGSVGPPQHPTGMRHFWFLTWAAAVSKLGNSFLSLAMPWTMLESTGSATIAALSMGVQHLPYVFSPVLGGLIDRFDRRRVFIVSEVLQGASVAVVPLLLMAHHTSLALLCLLLVGCGGVTSSLTSDYSLVPSLSPPDRLAEAYSSYGAVTSLARCIGPAVAGAVVALVGAHGALWFDAATFLATAGVAVRLPLQRKPIPSMGFKAMLVEGARAFRKVAGIPRLTVALAVFNLGAGSLPAVVVAISSSAWKWSSQSVGLALAAVAAGSAAGAWLGARLLKHHTLQQRIALWFGICLAGALVMLVPGPVGAIAGFSLLSVGEGGMNVTTNEYRALRIPGDLVGRVNAIVRAFAVGSVPLSSLLLGWSAGLPAAWLWLAPATAGALVALAVWLPSLRGAGTASTDRSRHQRPAPERKP